MATVFWSSLWLSAFLFAAASAMTFDYTEDYYVSGGFRSSSSEEEETDEPPKIWALLVAGSNGWYNYRHQADICHAYHVLKSHGIAESNIITMMYDDIAHNKENPFPGQLFNSPTGKDVYKGVKIDYKGEDVTPKNFLAILSGNQSSVIGGNGRVVRSTKKDKIFVFFSDHGATGLIAFPDEVLTVKDLTKTLRSMHANRRFSEMTFYLEACESGSMFEKLLPEELKIYAVTASNSHESSWGCYCDNTLKLPCLGDLFSVNWMEDSDKEDLKAETLKAQFDIVKELTNKSHVCSFGDLQIWKEHVSEFQGQEKEKRLFRYLNRQKVSPHDYKMWPSRDIPLLHLSMLRDQENDLNEQNRLNHEIHVMQKKRRYLESQIVAIVQKVIHDENNRRRVLTVYPHKLHKHLDCHHDVVHAFNRACFSFSKNPYAMKYVYVLANMCEMGIESDRLITVLMDHCADKAEDILEIQ